MKIVPTILTDNIETFKTQMKTIENFSDEVDLDVMDGTLFGESKTLPIIDMLEVETPLVRHLHLMLKTPGETIKTVLEYGIRSIVLHAEAEFEWKFDEILAEIGIALAPETKVKTIEPYLKSLSCVQIMTIDPGAQGHAFLPEQLKKIDELRTMGFAGEILIDGGVNPETIQEVEKSHADTVYVGSAIWKAENPEEMFKELQETIQNN